MLPLGNNRAAQGCRKQTPPKLRRSKNERAGRSPVTGFVAKTLLLLVLATSCACLIGNVWLAASHAASDRAKRMTLRSSRDASIRHGRRGDYERSTEHAHDTGIRDLERSSVVFSEGRAVVANRTIAYRYPKSFADLGGGGKGGAGDDDGGIIVVGVLSSPSNVLRREHVRRSWAGGDAGGNVFFVVGGEWTPQLAEEFESRGDVIWVDNSPEEHRTITYKTGVFFRAVQVHVASYEYLLKTDDDSYVDLEKLRHVLLGGAGKVRTGDYWGKCLGDSPVIRKPKSKWFVSKEQYPHDGYFPRYAQGGGYAMSRRFNDCAVSHIAGHPFLPLEDVWTGTLAEKCGVECHRNDRISKCGPLCRHEEWVKHKRGLVTNRVILFDTFSAPSVASGLGARDVGDAVGEQDESIRVQNDQEISEKSVVLFNRTFAYRLPKAFEELGRSGTDDDLVVVGVLSSPSNVQRRTAVRRTWAAGGVGNVFFLVGGDWTSELADELSEHGDLLWTDSPEGYRAITYKTGVFFHVVHTHVDSYKYLIKTDDDSYVNLERVRAILLDRSDSELGKRRRESRGPKWDYWGKCRGNAKPIRDPRSRKWFLSRAEYPRDVFPDYAVGVGYAMSSNFTACAVTHMASDRFLPLEDVWTGLLAERCGVQCRNDRRVENKGINERTDGSVISHRVYSENDMLALNQAQRDPVLNN